MSLGVLQMKSTPTVIGSTPNVIGSAPSDIGSNPRDMGGECSHCHWDGSHCHWECRQCHWDSMGGTPNVSHMICLNSGVSLEKETPQRHQPARLARSAPEKGFATARLNLLRPRLSC
jgi:hypothetical protein